MFDIDLSKTQVNKPAYQDMKDMRLQINPNAFYMGLVVNNQDSMMLGRVQVRIPAIHGTNANQNYYLEDSALPFARPAIFPSLANDSGQFLIPAVGTRVYVSFECNDLNKPIYFGGISLLEGDREYNAGDYVNNGKSYKTNTADELSNYKVKQRGLQTLFKSLKGSTIEIDDEDGFEKIRFISADGQVFEMGVTYSTPLPTPLPRRGNKVGTDNNPNSYMRYTNGTESIEVTKGKISLTAETIELNGEVKNNQ